MKPLGFGSIAVACSTIVASSAVPAQTAKVLSVVGSEQTCAETVTECPVAIFVKADPNLPSRSGCGASVTMDKVTAHGRSKVVWRLYKDESAGPDGNVYEFVDAGIRWVDPTLPRTPQKDAAAARKASLDFVIQPYTGARPEREWLSQGRTSAGGKGYEHHYEPTVRIKGAKVNCDANDPRIAND